MAKVCEKTGKLIIKGMIDCSRTNETHFAVKNELGVARFSRNFYISEHEILLMVGKALAPLENK